MLEPARELEGRRWLRLKQTHYSDVQSTGSMHSCKSLWPFIQKPQGRGREGWTQFVTGRRMMLSSMAGNGEGQPKSWLPPLVSMGFSPFLPNNPDKINNQTHKKNTHSALPATLLCKSQPEILRA